MHRSNSSEPLQSLAQISIFASLPSAALERIRRSCEWRLYEPGQQIVHYEDTSDDVFFLTKGVARVTIYSVDGKAVSFRELGPGDLFGEYPAIDGGPRSASVEARTACMVGQMHAPAFLELLENEPKVHNVVVCTLCSCYPWAVLGLPPSWYKSPAYRSRIVREPRTLLREMGLELPDDVEIRVWDSSAEVRYLVLPQRPDGTDSLTEEDLAGLVTRDAMIGTAKVESTRR